MAYVTIPGSAVKLRGESLVVEADDAEVACIELAHLEGLVAVGKVAVTSPALHALLERVIPLAMMTGSGRLKGRLVPAAAANVDARLGQFAVLSSDALRLAAARKVVRRKIAAMDAVLARWLSNHDAQDVRAARATLHRTVASVDAAAGLPALLGIEGSAARAYWSSFATMNASGLPFDGRSRRPPADPVNALLSLGYTLLANEIASVVDALGLDPGIGYYHVPKPGRPSLALDIIEPFRHAVVDRATLRALNLGMFSLKDFEAPSEREPGWTMVRESMKRFFEVYEEAMLGPADDTILESPGPKTGDAASGDKRSCRDAMRRRCEQLAEWFRTIASDKPAWSRWDESEPPRLAA